jgi:hypothetical protein
MFQKISDTMAETKYQIIQDLEGRSRVVRGWIWILFILFALTFAISVLNLKGDYEIAGIFFGMFFIVIAIIAASILETIEFRIAWTKAQK